MTINARQYKTLSLVIISFILTPMLAPVSKNCEKPEDNHFENGPEWARVS